MLDHIEAILISAVEPPHNRQGGQFGEVVAQFLRWRDADQLVPTADEMIGTCGVQKIQAEISIPFFRGPL